MLGAGVPQDSLDAIARSSVILISMPERWIPGLVDQLLEKPFDWKSKAVLLCESGLDSHILARLRYLGCATGSITPMAGFDEPMYILEGDRRALREARIVVESPGVRTIDMDAGSKALFSAGVSFATALALPLLTASVETLRACGIDPSDALTIADRLFQRTVRTYVKSGRKGWEGALPAQDVEATRRHLQALFQRNPILASYYYENALQVVQMFRKDPQWLSELRSDVYPMNTRTAIPGLA
jgi:predicted short-subunit dehydrogenase-like oxidoreductase (DUF2520 family)